MPLTHAVSIAADPSSQPLLPPQEALEALDLIGEGFFLLDPELHILFMNRSAERLISGDRDSQIGQKFFQAFPIVDRSRLEDVYRRARDASKPVAFQSGAPTGRHYDLLLRAAPPGIHLVVRDITDSQAREEALHSALAAEQVARLSVESAQKESRRRQDADRFVDDASRVLSSSLDYETTLQSLAQLAVPRLADWCVVHVIDESGGLRQLAVEHQDPKLARWARELQRRYPADLEASRGIGPVFRSGKPEVYRDMTDEMLVDVARDQEHLEMLRKVGFTSVMVVPLVARERVLGVISFVSAELGHNYSDEDLKLAQRLAHRAALAVDNALLYRAAQEEISQRARTEEALQESEARYRTLTNAVSQLIWMNDAQGNSVYFNEQWEQYVGVETLESGSVPMMDFVHPDDRDAVVAAREEGMRLGQAYESRCRLLRYDGVWRWHMARVVPIRDRSGKVQSWIGAAMDIHEMQMLMEQLTTRQMEVEQLNEQLRRAMTETHHRVKNNLQIMAAMIDMQVLDADTTVPVNELRRLNRHIRTLAVIHDLLTQKAREDGRAEELSARAMLLQLVPMLQQIAGGKQVESRLDDVHLSSRQATSLALVTNELISNALKHGNERIQVVFDVRDGTASLEVCDDGPGLPPDFDPTAYANTGLELVENLSAWDLDGRAIYSNRPEGGACVRIEFPVGAAQTA